MVLIEPLAESALMMIEWRRRVAPAIECVPQGNNPASMLEPPAISTGISSRSRQCIAPIVGRSANAGATQADRPPPSVGDATSSWPRSPQPSAAGFAVRHRSHPRQSPCAERRWPSPSIPSRIARSSRVPQHVRANEALIDLERLCRRRRLEIGERRNNRCQNHRAQSWTPSVADASITAETRAMSRERYSPALLAQDSPRSTSGALRSRLAVHPENRPAADESWRCSPPTGNRLLASCHAAIPGPAQCRSPSVPSSTSSGCCAIGGRNSMAAAGLIRCCHRIRAPARSLAAAQLLTLAGSEARTRSD